MKKSELSYLKRISTFEEYNENYITSEEDSVMIKKYVFDRQIKNSLNILFPITFITKNHMMLNQIIRLKKIYKPSDKILVLLRDIHMVSLKKAKKEMKEKKILQKIEYIIQKKEEVKNLLISTGIKEKDIFIISSSDILKKLSETDKYEFFFWYYEILYNLKTGDFTNDEKLSYRIIIPLEIMISNLFQHVFPELNINNIDLLFCTFKKVKTFSQIREIMFKQGFIDFKKPIILGTQNFPYLWQDNIMPNWDMSFEEIYSLLIKRGCTKKEFNELFKNVFSLLEIKKTKEIKSKKLNSLETFYLAKTIYEYFQILKKDLKIKTNPNKNIEIIKSSERLKEISSIFRSDFLLNVFLLCDGKNSISNISKKLKKHLSNTSKAVSILRKKDLIILNSELKPEKIRNMLVMDLLNLKK